MASSDYGLAALIFIWANFVAATVVLSQRQQIDLLQDIACSLDEHEYCETP